MKLSLDTLPLDRSGNTVVTTQLQLLIDEIDHAGGGMLTIPPGIWRTGTLILPSNFTLHLEAGACLRASTNAMDYQHVETTTVAELSRMALIYARDKQRITLSGEGRIDGDAASWFAPEADAQGYRQPKTHRPRLLVLEGCDQVRIHDITLYDSPMWTAHLVSCNRVFIHNLTIDNNLALSNTDALDIDSCQHVHISDSYFSAADDGICLKTTYKPVALQQPVRNVVVNNCIIRSKSCAIKLGTETFADIENVTVSNCTLFESNRGIGLVSRDGGRLQHLAFNNILFDCRHGHPCHWGKADPVFISVRHRAPALMPGTISHVTFNNLSGCAEGAINLHSETPGQIRDVLFNGLHFEQRLSDSAEQGCYDIRPPCNPDRPTGMGLDNAYNVNPATGRAHGVESYPGGLPAFYANGVHGLRLFALNLLRPAALPAHWHPEATVLLNTQNLLTDSSCL
ncbi:glycoside hydrolase family 28 protein [Salmonella enterica]|nr:glycoside hydrolase family 28 protein [Salmonella enterica]EDW4357918.1 glycoside hydrolase family 28 protein [Salmonella enterica subsp. salamae]HCM1882069.1 right-handed parallel beta-helix repeat-containing protein [Salmonella enterica subsp. salamae serovar 60:z10:z39]EAX8454343.1 glycoside hydrolase family 28 protein [Salmonella enterica]EAX8551658.1 glycoside hydrolase family 28 protein [Salmonella enterica]